MTLIYLDAINKDNTLVQFSFRADHQEILFKSEQIIKAFDKRYNPDYIAGELTYVKGAAKEIKTQLISKDGKFRF
jgi:hypothetical protein